ncbi:MAG TPA: hypothetical protein ENK13_05180 [Thermopetrobacter sp.]|nr:hypothetical protein [Thermopetrobacter sp.]
MFPRDAAEAAAWYVRQEPVPASLAGKLPGIIHDLLERGVLVGGKVERRIGTEKPWHMAAFGLAGFLDPRLAERLLKNPHPFLGMHILERIAEKGVRGTLLSRRRVARDNAAPEPRLNMVGLCWLQDHYDYSSADGRNLLEGVFRLIDRLLSGYHLATLMFEGRARHRDVHRTAGFQKLIDFSDDADPRFAHLRADPRYRPHLQGIFLRSAVNELLPGSPVARLFVHRQPVFGLTEAQKQVVDLALDGLSDAEIARHLGIRENAVQMRWKHIYERIESLFPDFFLSRGMTDANIARGREKRRMVLGYMEDHREELRPWNPGRNARRRA